VRAEDHTRVIVNLLMSGTVCINIGTLVHLDQVLRGGWRPLGRLQANSITKETTTYVHPTHMHT